MIDARHLLTRLLGQELRTLTGKPNRILRLEAEHVLVATGRSPEGRKVLIAEVQKAIDALSRFGELEISVKSVGYRSAFIGAVLATLPNTVTSLRPRRIRLVDQETRTNP